MLLGQRGYARYRHVWQSRVQRALKAGVIQATPEGKIETDDADAKWLAWEASRNPVAELPLLEDVTSLDMNTPIIAAADPPPRPVVAEPRVSESEARRRREVAQAELRELELGEKRRELLPAADVHAVWAEQLAALRDRFMNLPERLAEELVGLPAQEIRAQLRAGIEEALRGAHADLR